MYMRTVRLWVVCFSSGGGGSGSPPLVQSFTSVACRLLFIADENAHLMVVTMLKNAFVAENLLYQILVLLCSLYLL